MEENNSVQEIVLTEVVEPPKEKSFTQENTTPLSPEDDVQGTPETGALFDSEKQPVLPQEEDLDALIKEALQEDMPCDENIMLQESLQEEIACEKHLESTKESNNEEILVEEKESVSHDALDKLDNLDAMIDTMIATPVVSDTSLLETIDNLRIRIEKLEHAIIPVEHKESPEEELLSTHIDHEAPLAQEITREDTVIVQKEQPTDDSFQELHERTVILEGQLSSLQSNISEIQDHLESLLSIPKKINDIEKSIASFSSSTTAPTEEYTSVMQSIDEKIQNLHSSIEQTTQSLEVVSLLEKRSDEVESKLHTLLEQQEERSQLQIDTTLSEITSKLQQLEHTIENIVEKQHKFEENNSLQVLHDTLLPRLQKEAILAASNIIKEELQTILEWK